MPKPFPTSVLTLKVKPHINYSDEDEYDFETRDNAYSKIDPDPGLRTKKLEKILV